MQYILYFCASVNHAVSEFYLYICTPYNGQIDVNSAEFIPSLEVEHFFQSFNRGLVMVRNNSI